VSEGAGPVEVMQAIGTPVRWTRLRRDRRDQCGLRRTAEENRQGALDRAGSCCYVRKEHALRSTSLHSVAIIRKSP
jgi:hypothetical protein